MVIFFLEGESRSGLDPKSLTRRVDLLLSSLPFGVLHAHKGYELTLSTIEERVPITSKNLSHM